MPLETEVKIKINKEDESRFFSVFGTPEFRCQENYVFDLEKGYVRVRYENGKYILTYKSERQNDKFGSREEIETIVDSGEILKILRGIGLQEGAFYIKDRASYFANDCVVSLDVIDEIGTYVEVEGQEKEILEILEVLGLKDREPEKKSYSEILKKNRTAGARVA